MLYVFLVVLVVAPVTCSLRGVDPSKTSQFQGSQFHCADGSQSFPMDFVNDDYCDCNDGSDEPGTSACPNGSFYCANKGFKGTLIASSRVDDGICDCCDGTDEIGGHCTNNCRELGAHLQEEARRIRRQQAEGFQIRMGYIADGKAAKVRREDQIRVLAEEEELKRKEADERKEYKEQVEEPAKAAKETAKAAFDAEEETRKTKEQEEIRLEAEGVLTRIDADNSGDVSIEELLAYGSDPDAILPYEEIQLMTDSGEIEAATLLDRIQTEITAKKETAEREKKREEEREKRRAKKPKLRDVTAVQNEEGEELWGEDGQKISKHTEEEEDEYEDVEDYEEEEEEEDPKPVRNTLVYDAATQELIDVFEEAEKLYNEAKKQHDTAKRQLTDLEKISALDFGEEEEFYSLHGQCYHFKDEKYNYKLCPFDKCEQDGTSLGKWDGWGEDHSTMKYTKGAGCWQGPARSTVVTLICGSENAITEASEPAKCEYAFTFTTPAKCNKVMEEVEIHDEL